MPVSRFVEATEEEVNSFKENDIHRYVGIWGIVYG